MNRYSFPFLSLRSPDVLFDLLIKPDGEIIDKITQDQWQIKWAEILSYHVSPHEVWTRHPNWALFPDGEHLYQHPVKGPIPVVIRNGKRLIRNHREYWKKTLVPRVFTEEQWDMMCWYFDPRDRYIFWKGTDTDRLNLYNRYRERTDLVKALGKDRRGDVYRMDTWMWGSGDCSGRIVLRSKGNPDAFGRKGTIYTDHLNHEDFSKAIEGECVWPRYTNIYYCLLRDSLPQKGLV